MSKNNDYFYFFNSISRGTVRFGSLIVIILIYFLVGFIEETYKKKSWYGPQYWPPDHYIKGYLLIMKISNKLKIK